MKPDNQIYPNGRIHIIWDNSRNKKKPYISVEADKGIYSIGSFEIDWNNAVDTIKGNDPMKLEKEINFAKNGVPE